MLWPTFDQDLTNPLVKCYLKRGRSKVSQVDYPLTNIRQIISGKYYECSIYLFFHGITKNNILFESMDTTCKIASHFTSINCVNACLLQCVAEPKKIRNVNHKGTVFITFKIAALFHVTLLERKEEPIVFGPKYILIFGSQNSTYFWPKWAPQTINQIFDVVTPNFDLWPKYHLMCMSWPNSTPK